MNNLRLISRPAIYVLAAVVCAALSAVQISHAAGRPAGCVRSVSQHLVTGGQIDRCGHGALDRQTKPADGWAHLPPPKITTVLPAADTAPAI